MIYSCEQISLPVAIKEICHGEAFINFARAILNSQEYVMVLQSK